MPKISVIVPVYNTEKYLKRCLDSIVDQTYKDIEIVIINDGSTDNSEDIILKYKKEYSSIIKYIKKENTGIAETRNIGVENAVGEYFIFVDSDDFIDNTLIEKLIKYVTENRVDIIKYKMTIIKENESEKVAGPVFEMKNGEEAFDELCFKDILIDTPCLYLFKTQFYKENNFKFLKNTYHEDFGLIPLIIIRAKLITSIDIYGYYYMYTQNSITRNENHKKSIKRAYDLLQHYDNMICFIENNKLSKQTEENLKRYFTNAIYNSAKKIKGAERKKYSKEIRKRNLIKNIKVKNLKHLVKKIILRNR